MRAPHSGFAFSQDTFDLPIWKTVLVNSVSKNADKVTLYCQGGIECENRSTISVFLNSTYENNMPYKSYFLKPAASLATV